MSGQKNYRAQMCIYIEEQKKPLTKYIELNLKYGSIIIICLFKYTGASVFKYY